MLYNEKVKVVRAALKALGYTLKRKRVFKIEVGSGRACYDVIARGGGKVVLGCVALNDLYMYNEKGILKGYIAYSNLE